MTKEELITMHYYDNILPQKDAIVKKEQDNELVIYKEKELKWLNETLARNNNNNNKIEDNHNKNNNNDDNDDNNDNNDNDDDDTFSLISYDSLDYSFHEVGFMVNEKNQ